MTSGRLLVVAGAMLWGTTGTAQALGTAVGVTATPAGVGAARIVVGALGLLALTLLSGAGRDLRRLATDGRWRALLAGASAVAAYQPLFFGGVARTGVAVGTVVAIGSAPMWTGVIGYVVRRERPESRWLPATGLATVGAALLVTAGSGEVGVDPLGVLFTLGAGLCFGVLAVASRTLIAGGTGSVQVMAALFSGGALLLAPLLIREGAGWVLTGAGAATALWLGLVATTVAYVLFARGLATVPAASAATLALAEPLTAGVLGVAVLGERPGLLGTAGALLVLAGLVLLSVQRVPSPHSRTNA